MEQTARLSARAGAGQKRAHVLAAAPRMCAHLLVVVAQLVEDLLEPLPWLPRLLDELLRRAVLVSLASAPRQPRVSPASAPRRVCVLSACVARCGPRETKTRHLKLVEFLLVVQPEHFVLCAARR